MVRPFLSAQASCQLSVVSHGLVWPTAVWSSLAGQTLSRAEIESLVSVRVWPARLSLEPRLPRNSVLPEGRRNSSCTRLLCGLYEGETEKRDNRYLEVEIEGHTSPE